MLQVPMKTWSPISTGAERVGLPSPSGRPWKFAHGEYVVVTIDGYEELSTGRTSDAKSS
jgi:hypothetical protein